LSGNSAGLQKVLDFQTKVRDIELNVIDAKGDIERRMAAINEAVMSKMDRDLQNIEQKQTSVQS